MTIKSYYNYYHIILNTMYEINIFIPLEKIGIREPQLDLL